MSGGKLLSHSAPRFPVCKMGIMIIFILQGYKTIKRVLTEMEEFLTHCDWYEMLAVSVVIVVASYHRYSYES